MPDMPPSGLSGVGTEPESAPSQRPTQCRTPHPTDPKLTVIREDLDAGEPIFQAVSSLVRLPSAPRCTPECCSTAATSCSATSATAADLQLWQGEDQVLARPVAIRLMIDTGLPTALEAIHQLLDAARRSGQLVHNGAASTYDATTTSADGLPLAYVVSEWVNGVSLLDLLREAPLQPDRAAAVLLSVARVVAAAHAVGVTHGDLHPGDVIITSHGLVKVLDLEMRSSDAAAANPPSPSGRPVT